MIQNLPRNMVGHASVQFRPNWNWALPQAQSQPTMQEVPAEHQLGDKRTLEDIRGHDDKRTRLRPVIQVCPMALPPGTCSNICQGTTMNLKMKRANDHLLEQWRVQNDFMRQQAEALQQAQKMMQDLRSAQEEMAKEKQTLWADFRHSQEKAEQEKLRLTEQLAATEMERQEREAKMNKELEALKA